MLAINEIIKNESLTHVAAFHAQQAVEKIFKAVVEEYSLNFLKTHDLIKLYGHIENKIKLDIDFEILKMLNGLYTSSRYPGDLGLLPNGKPDIDDALLLYNFAKDLHEMINKSLQQVQ